MSPSIGRLTTTPGVVVYRLDDRLFFANVRYVRGRVLEAIQGTEYEVRTLVFDAEAITHVDSSGLQLLTDLQRSFKNDGIRLVLARVKSTVRAQFDRVGLSSDLGESNFFPTVRAAVDSAVA
jgi:SulP family sulfate permease